MIRNIKYILCGLLCFVAQITIAQVKTEPAKSRYQRLISRYTNGDSRFELIDTLYRDAWFPMKDTAMTKNIANRFVEKKDFYSPLRNQELDLLKFMVATSKSPDMGFDFYALSQKFQKLLVDYRTGHSSPGLERNLAQMALLVDNKSVSYDIANAYIDKLTTKDVFTPENLYFLRDFTKTSNSKGFKLFMQYHTKINMLTEPHFAERAIGWIIYTENVAPFIKNSSSKMNWDSLRNSIVLKYGKIGEEEYLRSKLYFFYNNYQDSLTTHQLMFEYLNKYYSYEGARALNNMAWKVFENSEKPQELESAIKWSRKATELEPGVGNWLDTYANLLYKLGSKGKAIAAENKAILLDPENEEIKANLDKMKKGVKTWPDKTSVKFDSSLRLSAILEKSKAEGKPIFFDFMATWCGPCKEMDKYVYTDQDVRNILDNNFIAVKIQTDKTATDSEYVRGWRADAEKLMREYDINGFPTLIFINPDGKIGKKIVGTVDAKRLIVVAKEVLKNN